MAKARIRIGEFEIEVESDDKNVSGQLEEIVKKLSSEEFGKVLDLASKHVRLTEKQKSLATDQTLRESSAQPTTIPEKIESDETFGDFLHGYNHKNQMPRKMLLFGLYKSINGQSSYERKEYFKAAKDADVLGKSEDKNWSNNKRSLKEKKFITILEGDKIKITKDGKNECKKWEIGE